MTDENGNRGGHLLFLWSPAGWTLHERDGDAPPSGSTVEEAGTSFRISKVGPSPLPGDRRACAYTQPA